MHFYRNLYFSPNITNPEIVRWRLAHNAGSPAVYVIMLPQSDPGKLPQPGGNQLEICHCSMLHQPWYKKHPPYIVGIAEGRQQALLLVERIVREALEATGKPLIQEYLFPEHEPAACFTGRKKRSGQ